MNFAFFFLSEYCTEVIFFKNHSIMASEKKKRKTSDSATVPALFHGLGKLKRADHFIHIASRKNHLGYYKYEKKTHKTSAADYLFEKTQQNELLPQLSTLIEIQKSHMKPELFESLEGACYRWKYERVLEGRFVEKFKDNNMLQDLKMPASMPGLKDSKDHIQAENFSKNFLDLKKNCRIVLELKKENDFHPWIYFKTVKEEDGKERIGMFAGRNFPWKSTIGFYISHPWLRWTEPFTIQPPLEYDKHFQDKHLLPVNEANSYFWFYDDEGFITACDPLRKPPLPEGT
jgi:hypothetical protein